MCTYDNHQVEIRGSGKANAEWVPLQRANAYVDHPQHAMVEHSLNLDFFGSQDGVLHRIAVELAPSSGRALAQAILAALDATPAELLVG